MNNKLFICQLKFKPPNCSFLVWIRSSNNFGGNVPLVLLNPFIFNLNFYYNIICKNHLEFSCEFYLNCVTAQVACYYMAEIRKLMLAFAHMNIQCPNEHNFLFLLSMKK